MYLSRMELNTGERNTMKALVSPNLFHGVIEAAFPGPRERKLWRIDRLGGKYYLLLLSPERPQLHRAAAQFGFPDSGMPWETKDYGPLLARIREGEHWHFRLTANPTKACKEEAGGRGTVHAHITVNYQKRWLLERCRKHGFSLEEESFTVVNSRWLRFYKGNSGKRPVTLLAVSYEGLLEVTDAQLFQKTLTEGMGWGKAFGLGLLTVVRAGD